MPNEYHPGADQLLMSSARTGPAPNAFRDLYYFGKLAKEIDYFAFPRSGSHFFLYCCSGMFDMISFLLPEIFHSTEAIERQQELKESVLYTLDLREANAPFEPVWFNRLATGIHGLPGKGPTPAIILIRDPVAAAFSRYRVNQSRWDTPVEDLRTWLENLFTEWEIFYDVSFERLAASPANTLLVRYEALLEGPEALEEVARFVGVRPKLRPSFVYETTRFERFVRPGERTFFRQGQNSAWKNDAAWVELIASLPERDFRRFGYSTLSSYVPEGIAPEPVPAV
jgi:hypothetical protein